MQQNRTQIGLNLKLRGEILEYSLNMEESINDLLLLNLGMYDNGVGTRLFSGKNGLTFKNKIDLLFDLKILTKDENFDFELLMIFRNKFLHDINCNSFEKVFNLVDNNIKNKLKKYLNEDKSIENEDDCLSAFGNLFLKNLKTLQVKVGEGRKELEKRKEILEINQQQLLFQIDLFFDLINEIYLNLESSELEEEKVRQLAENISKTCSKYVDKYSKDESFALLSEKQKQFFTDINSFRSYFGIRRANNLSDNLNVK